MKIELSQYQNNMKKEIEQFVNSHVIPCAAKHDKQQQIEPELISKIKEEGYLGAVLPKQFGGIELDSITLGILHEEFGRGCSSIRSLLTVHGMVSLAILRWGTNEQREAWLYKMSCGETIGAFCLTEPNIGSDAKNVETIATLNGGHYTLNGRKKWITMGQIAGLFLVFAQCEGKPTAFLIERDTPGLTITPIKGLLGVRASMTAELQMKDCIIPKENLLGSIGTGLTHIAMSALDYGRYSIACGCVGIGQACIDECAGYVKKRQQFQVALRKHQLIQKLIAEMVVDVKASRLLCYYAGYLKEIGDSDSIMETWTAKYFASTMINKVANNAVQIFGANGCSDEYPIERLYRDARINEIIEGTTQMHEILIAINTIKKY